MTGALDEREHIAVLAGLLNAALGPDPANENGPRCFDYGKVPGADGNKGTLPPIYTLVSLERRYAEPTRGGRQPVTGWRLSVRYVGRTVDEARWAAVKVTDAINEARIEVEDIKSTPITHEATQSIRPEDGRQTGMSQWTYAL